MKTIKSNCTDAELSAAVAEHVAGWTRDPKWTGYWIPPGEKPLLHGNYYTARPPKFATSADAVLPLLEKWVGEDKDYRRVDVIIHANGNFVELRGFLPHGAVAHHNDTIPRCACFALLKAKGWTVEEAT